MNTSQNKSTSQVDLIATAIRMVQEEKLTYLDGIALRELADAVAIIESERVKGCFIEAGCALGGSALVIASAKAQKREFIIYDVFGMIPPPSDKDGEDVHYRYETIAEGKSVGICGDEYYGYQNNLMDKVVRMFDFFNLSVRRNRIHLIKGLYENTLILDSPVAFAHIDCDWYDSVMTCLRRIEPHLSRNGILVIDDYYAWSGCRAAVDEYFSDKKAGFEFIEKSRLHIRKC